MTLRDRIRDLANAKGMSLPILEATLGFGNGTIVRWDKSSPTAEKLQKVADYFNVSTDYLLGREPMNENTGANDAPDEEFTILSRNAKKLSPEDRKQLLEIARIMFKEEFKD